jgi:hypothetical protein
VFIVILLYDLETRLIFAIKKHGLKPAPIRKMGYDPLKAGFYKENCDLGVEPGVFIGGCANFAEPKTPDANHTLSGFECQEKVESRTR